MHQYSGLTILPFPCLNLFATLKIQVSKADELIKQNSLYLEQTLLGSDLVEVVEMF